MKITRQQANTLFAEQGFASAETWPDAKMQTKLGQAVSRFVPDNFQTEESKALFVELTAASEKGEAIELSEAAASDTPPPAEKPAKVAKGKKAPTPAKEEEKPAAKPAKAEKEKPAAKEKPAKAEKSAAKPTPPKAEVEKDAFGFRTGTQSSSINALVKGEWVNEADIIKAAKLGDVRVRDHLSILLTKGLVEKESVRRWRLSPEMAKKLAAKE